MNTQSHKQSSENPNSDAQSTKTPPINLVADFWQASAHFYANSPVKSLLLSLQDQHFYSVNRLLFTLWFSQQFQQLIDQQLLSKAKENIERCETSVRDLRTSRRQFESQYFDVALDKINIAGNLKAARHHLLEAELTMEREIQERLVLSLCDGKYRPVDKISAETLDFLIAENINLLCLPPPVANNDKLQQLSVLWIQHQDCYNTATK
ncbi:MAG: TIGR02444 family protein [Kangiellaceae bacterium]|nr:TIGR02444 family protein [Kangiellaceae bacterium]